jgi:hypothetical protein
MFLPSVSVLVRDTFKGSILTFFAKYHDSNKDIIDVKIMEGTMPSMPNLKYNGTVIIRPKALPNKLAFARYCNLRIP